MKVTRNTAHLQRTIPVMALVSALIGIWRRRRPEQLRILLEDQKG